MPRLKNTLAALTVVGMAASGCSAESQPPSTTLETTHTREITPPAPLRPTTTTTTETIDIGNGGEQLKDAARNQRILTGLQGMSGKLIEATKDTSKPGVDGIWCTPALFGEEGQYYTDTQQLPAGQDCDVRKLGLALDPERGTDPTARASILMFTNHDGQFDVSTIHNASATSPSCEASLGFTSGTWYTFYRDGNQVLESNELSLDKAGVDNVDTLALDCLRRVVDDVSAR